MNTNIINGFILCMLVLSVIRLILSVDVSAQGMELAQLEQEKVDWQAKNDQLREQILRTESLRTIHDKALQLGMRETSLYYLK